MTKLISLSVPLTAFKRTLSHPPSLSPPPILPSLLYCRVDVWEKNSWLMHFVILPTVLLEPPALPPFLHPSSHLSFIAKHRQKSERCILPGALQWYSDWTRCDKKILKTLSCVLNISSWFIVSCACVSVCVCYSVCWSEWKCTSHQQWVVDFESRLCNKVIIRLEGDSEHVGFGVETRRRLLPTPTTPNYSAGLWLVLHFNKVIPGARERVRGMER